MTPNDKGVGWFVANSQHFFSHLETVFRMFESGTARSAVFRGFCCDLPH
jgi:hypothetical protein